MAHATALDERIHDRIHDAVRQNPARSLDGLLERGFSRLFLGLVYPQIWEDPVVDMRALDIGPDDALVCIASGGCNMMAYLTVGPASVTAVDLSPAHVALGRLKLAAAERLEQAAFHRFFAGACDPENVAVYDRALAPHLDAGTRAYWEGRSLGRRRITFFARGFYRHGVLGRFLGSLHFVARLGGVDLRELVACESVEDQRRFFEERIDPLISARPVRFLARRRAALFGLGIPPAQYDKLAADGGCDVLPVLRERIRKLACDFPVGENYFAWQAFARRYDAGPKAALPPYLAPGNFDALRAHAPRARLLNRSLTEVLAAEAGGSKHGYVLLDAQDWMNDAQLASLWAEIDRTAAADARVIYRTGGSADILPGRVPAAILGRWRYDAAASAQGTARDRSAIYGGFHVWRRAA
jgi:S-adenosylmethionine-diacylglycerol 3-amino-3-carboxypropyl transferase